LTTDFSQEAIAAIVSQEQEGEEKFIAAAGRKTTKYEANYASVKGELAAVIYALRKFEHLLRFRSFVLQTDSAALRYLRTMKLSRGIWFRWLTEIQSFDFEVKHRAGKSIPHVDGLSRSGHLPPPTKEEEREQEELIQELEEEDYIDEVGEDLDTDNLKRAQREDEMLQQVAKWIAEDKKLTKEDIKRCESKEMRTYAVNLASLEEVDGILYQKFTSNLPMEKQKLRAIIPEKLRDQVFYHAHLHPSSGHFGELGTSTRAAQSVDSSESDVNEWSLVFTLHSLFQEFLQKYIHYY
jgi:hypothetical protein